MNSTTTLIRFVGERWTTWVRVASPCWVSGTPADGVTGKCANSRESHAVGRREEGYSAKAFPKLNVSLDCDIRGWES